MKPAADVTSPSPVAPGPALQPTMQTVTFSLLLSDVSASGHATDVQVRRPLRLLHTFPCLEARCVCRQAAVKAAKTLPLVGLARSKQDPINGAQYLYRPPPAGATLMCAVNCISHAIAAVPIACALRSYLSFSPSLLNGAKWRLDCDCPCAYVVVLESDIA